MTKQNTQISAGLSKMFEDGYNHFKKGNDKKAIAIITKILEHRPREAEPYMVCAAAFSRLGEHARAVEILEEALEENQDNPELYKRWVNALFNAGETRKSIKEAQEAVEKFPEYTQLFLTYSAICSKVGQSYFKDGAEAALKVLEDDPENYEAMNLIGGMLMGAGKYPEASEYYIKALRIKPDFLPAIIGLAGCFKNMGEQERALQLYNSALEIRPDSGIAMCNKSDIMCNHGLSQEYADLLEKGIEALLRAADYDNYLSYLSNYVFFVHYIPHFSRQKIRDTIHSWYKKTCSDIQEKPRTEFKNSPDEDRKLRIGLMSFSFRRHPTTWMTLAALENIDREKFEIYCYSDIVFSKRDDVTTRYFGLCDEVRDIQGWSNTEVTDLIRNDNLDILLELTGHSEGGRRLPVTAARVAPVQVKWVGGLFNTTGLPQMDWILGDKIEIPEGDEKWYSERVYRMPDDYIVYEPPFYVDEVRPLPALENGYITFGNLNNLCKTNTYSIALWSKVLKAVPKSRLLIKVNKLDTPFAKKNIEDQFAKHGIGIERLILEGGEAHKFFMETNHRIDIALDPHPYTGGLTTCEALWMGVPVITLPGETFAGRHAATHLYHAGLEDWIAKDEQDYIDIAAKWSNDIEGLARLRAGLREKVANSPLTDGPRFARNLEKALRFMWKDWCDEKRTGSKSEVKEPQKISAPKPKKKKKKKGKKR